MTQQLSHVRWSCWAISFSADLSHSLYIACGENIKILYQYSVFDWWITFL